MCAGSQSAQHAASCPAVSGTHPPGNLPASSLIFERASAFRWSGRVALPALPDRGRLPLPGDLSLRFLKWILSAIFHNTAIWVYIWAMKTTIDISDHLLNRAKELARREKSTLKELTEEGLELALARRASGKHRQVKPVVFAGQGLSPEFRGKSWAEIRNEIYKGSGA